MLTSRDKLLFTMELRQCFSLRRIPIFVVMICIGIFVVVQESELSPFVVVFMTVFAVLESQFNNIFFRSPHELQALSMFPISWRRIVLLKNLATILLTGIVTMIVAMAVLYFSPQQLRSELVTQALQYSSTILFPLLHVGNSESLRSPRRTVGWQTDDLIQAAGMLLFVVVLSMPFIIFTFVLRLQVLNLLYAVATLWHWYKRSVPQTAFTLEQRKTEICSTL